MPLTAARPAREASPVLLAALRDGTLEVLGRLPGSTNQALVVLVHHPDLDEPFHAVYKARVAERPLFDFPAGTLARREVAAFLVSEALGWEIVPPTVLRDGPFGEGMVQQWIEADESIDRVALVVEADSRLRRMAAFDAAVNNTDRKVGHILPMADGHVHGVDHGVTFSTDPKLRTVLWGWMGTPFVADEVAGLERLRSGLADRTPGSLGVRLAELLAPDEVTATRRRVASLLRYRRFPRPNPDWPAVPWPAY
ncbi:MAG: SCO1664 family protein [Chloroflexi bacterium]|nr:SCO1664 family protein [Chloroflexota bacterium]